MKKITALLAVLCFIAAARAQSLSTSVDFNKTTQPALMLDLPYTQDVVEGFIVSNLKKTGYDPESKGKFFWKQNKVNGFYTFKGVRLEGVSTPVDLYFKIEPKSRQIKDQSTVYMMVSKGNEHFISSSTDDTTFNKAKDLLDHFSNQSAEYKQGLDVKAQEDVVKDAEKKMDKLRSNEKDLSRRILELNNELKRNQEDQKNQEVIIENERRKLETLKTKSS